MTPIIRASEFSARPQHAGNSPREVTLSRLTKIPRHTVASVCEVTVTIDTNLFG
jgi:hypothetical protein